MTSEEILRLAREADCGHESMLLVWIPPVGLLRFAELVAAAEREACAKVCDHYATALDGGDNHYLRSAECRQAAAKIRARSAKP